MLALDQQSLRLLHLSSLVGLLLNVRLEDELPLGACVIGEQLLRLAGASSRDEWGELLLVYQQMQQIA